MMKNGLPQGNVFLSFSRKSEGDPSYAPLLVDFYLSRSDVSGAQVVSGSSFGALAPRDTTGSDAERHNHLQRNAHIRNSQVVPEVMDQTDSSGETPKKSEESLQDRRDRPRVSAFTKFKRRMMDVAVGEPLQDFVLWVIVLNTLFMMCDSNVNLCLTTQSDLYSAFRFDSEVLFARAEDKKNSPVKRAGADYKAVIEGSNMIFTIIFVCELLFKLFALGPKRFFIAGKTKNWNIFDFVVVSISVSEFQLVYAKVSCLAKAETCLAAES